MSEKLRTAMEKALARSLYETDGFNRSVVSIEFGNARDARALYELLKELRTAQ